mmetsp:Transcript_14812/g.59317  ORF Transcript_14812/g.59317 Transcript_14812/m.59317 type:complete len:244 (-) Transcript_14812:107-838(-)
MTAHLVASRAARLGGQLGGGLRRPPPTARPPTQSFATSSVEERLRPLLWLIGYYSDDSTRSRNAESILQSCSLQAHHPAWVRRGLLPAEDFRPRHTLIMTHVWMVHRRLHAFAPGKPLRDAKLLQEVLFDELWEDTTRRIRAIDGVAEISVDKHLRDVQRYSFAAAVEYDRALLEENADERLDKLAAAVWRHVYLASDEDQMTVSHCEHVARYLQSQLAMLAELPEGDVVEAKFKWATPRFED